MKIAEPPSCNSIALPLVFIGRNRKGDWVAQQQNGLYGGLFVTRAQAIKYALFENGRHPEAIVEVPRARARHGRRFRFPTHGESHDQRGRGGHRNRSAV